MSFSTRELNSVFESKSLPESLTLQAYLEGRFACILQVVIYLSAESLSSFNRLQRSSLGMQKDLSLTLQAHCLEGRFARIL